VKLLLDTHALLWALGDPGRLKSETRRVLAEGGNAVFVSVVSLWEIVVKRRIGKLEADIASITAQMAPASKMQLLSITPQHYHALGTLSFHDQHRDPFDHLLIAQAISEGMTLITQDQHVTLYPVRFMAP
jgi:PIN domain nuclease of toxin-antitoxin system